jgi:hypothetical protein
MTVTPAIADGRAGIVSEMTVKELAALLPHELTAATLMVPPVDAGMAEMLLPVLLPLQPEGNAQT